MTTLNDQAATAAIGAATRELRLPVVRAEAARHAQTAQKNCDSYLAYLAGILCAETDERETRRRARLTKEARFPRTKRLADFDLANTTITPQTIALLTSGTFIDTAQPVVLLGDSGTGKTHLLIGAGHAACETGRRVRYTTTAALVNELAEAADQHRLSRLITRYSRVDLLCLDELGYVALDPRGAELLFQIITERDERASIAVASNLPFSEWGTIIRDARLVAAIVDRVTHNAHIIQTGTTSYRLLNTKRHRQSGAKTNEHSGANSD